MDNEIKIAAAIARTVADGGTFCTVPKSMLPHDETLVTFDREAHMDDPTDATFPRPQPLPDEVMPTDREWTDYEWVRNQWYMANEHNDLLMARVQRLQSAMVKCVLPYEALLLDGGSRRWIAPSIWAMMEDAVAGVRATLADQGGEL